MNILFLFVSLPNLNDCNGIFASMIKEFHANGHKVWVSAKGNKIDTTTLSIEANIPILRIKSNDFTGVKSSVKKALAYQEYAVKQLWQTCKFFKNIEFDLIISHSLPPELAFITNGLKKKFKCPLYLIQTDFIWQDAVAFGYFSRNSPVAFYYRFWERLLFKTADYIACPTVGNISFIKQYYPDLDDSKFRFLPFWQKPIEPQGGAKLKDQHGFKDKFVVVYGGSVGAAQRVEHLVELAESCQEYDDIVFVVLGKGAHLGFIRDMVSTKHLKNVVFKEFLPQDEYLQFLFSCDVGMIILHEKMATPNFPSKSLSYLNMKVPILAALDHTTDFGEYLESHNAGLWGYSDDIATLKKKLLMYYESLELRNQVKENGYQLFINNMTPEHAYRTIISDFIDE